MKVHRVVKADLRFACQLEIAGLSCAVQTNSSELVRALMKDWAPQSDDLAPGFVMEIFVAPGSSRAGNRAPHFRGMQHLVFATFHLTDVFVFNVPRRMVTGVVSEETAGDLRFWNRVLIPIAIGVLGPSMGTTPLHCACLTKGDDGVLIAGESGAGKSTLSVAMARRGFEFISDDWTYVGKGPHNELIAHGLRVPAKLLPDCAEFFPELRNQRAEVTMNGELAFEAEVDRVFGQRVRGRCAVFKVILLRRSAVASAQLTKIGGSSVAEFFRRSAERLPAELREAEQNREEIFNAFHGIDCWTFEYGGSPAEGAEALGRFLESR